MEQKHGAEGRPAKANVAQEPHNVQVGCQKLYVR